MAAAMPFIAGMITAKVVSEVVTGITGNETLGMVAGMASGYWAGGMVSSGASGATGGGAAAESVGSDVVAGGTTTLGSTSPQTFGEIGGATEGVATAGDGGSQLFGGTESFSGASSATSSPVLIESAGRWVERNPMAASMGFNAVSGIAGQKMAEDGAIEAEKRAAEREEARYAREHQAIDLSNVPKLADVNRGLIEGGYRSPGTRLREGRSGIAGSTLPNYQLLLDRYKGKA